MTIPPPPSGQGPVDPRGVFAPPPPPMMPPPPFGPPPPPFYPFPPPAPRGGFGRAILTTLATSIFGLSIALNLYLLLMSGILGARSDSIRSTVLISGDAKQKVAVVSLTGVLVDATSERFERVMRHIEDDSDIKALVLDVNTPGGTVTASDEIYARILKYKEAKHVPVVVTMGSVAASGGYYLSCASDKIFAQRTTITGSIGVAKESFNVSKLADRWGIEDTSQHATGADFKLIGSPFRPETDSDRAYWLTLLDDAFGTFKAVVTKGRGSKLKAKIEDVANGKVFTASEALQLGLVDQIGYRNDAIDAAASLASLSNKQVVQFEQQVSFFDALTSESKVAPASAQASASFSGMNVNIDKAWVAELMTPRLMYLWSGR